MHNKIVKGHITHILKMLAQLGETRQWAARRIWANRMRFWWKLRHKTNNQVIAKLVSIQRIGENRFGAEKPGHKA